MTNEAVKEWLEGQAKYFYFSGMNSQKNVANTSHSVAIVLKNSVQFVTFPFLFMVELQNLLNGPRSNNCVNYSKYASH